MAYFLGRLLAPRRTFPADITETEKKLMQEHVVYWSEFIEKGKVLALGPVADPKGMWDWDCLRSRTRLRSAP